MQEKRLAGRQKGIGKAEGGERVRDLPVKLAVSRKEGSMAGGKSRCLRCGNSLSRITAG